MAVVLHEPRVGGASTAVLRALTALERRGWGFCFWAPQPSPVAELLRDRGYRVEGEARPMRYSWAALGEPPGRRARLLGTPGYLRRVRRFVADVAPDLVHANTLVTLPEALAARAAGTPTMLHVHEMMPRDARGVVAARLARMLDGVATVSEAAAAALRRHGIEADVVTAGLALDGAPTRPRPAGRLVIGTIATVSHRKGSDRFVDAAATVLAERPDVEFRMVGPLPTGHEARWAREQVARARRAGIRWDGPAQTSAVLADWDIFVLPTRRDPFPLVVLEAMAAGLPVVASRVDGLVEQVDAATGVLVAPEDAAGLCQAILALIDEPRRREAMARAAEARVRSTFTPERHADELERAYRHALDASSSRRAGAGRS